MATAQRGEINAGSLTLRADVINNDPACASRLSGSYERVRACWERIYVRFAERTAHETQEKAVRA